MYHRHPLHWKCGRSSSSIIRKDIQSQLQGREILWLGGSIALYALWRPSVRPLHGQLSAHCCAHNGGAVRAVETFSQASPWTSAHCCAHNGGAVRAVETFSQASPWTSAHCCAHNGGAVRSVETFLSVDKCIPLSTQWRSCTCFSHASMWTSAHCCAHNGGAVRAVAGDLQSGLSVDK